ncbi:glycosyltransferase family 2 protein [Streptomyces sp. NPDC059009]|uniref:glycosyltransferase family 2 protein n=1 Tax=Streptomyces sp. NPDC059009 TaxID=3346694 RepID=UPI003690C106
MGTRPRELAALLDSIAAQDVPAVRTVLVGNGSPPLPGPQQPELPGELTVVELDENLGCPGGRNVAIERLRAWGGGFAEGVRESCGERRPMRWRTVWWLTRLGRPPVI